LFIIIGNMFILNLFVGVVIENFNRMKDKLCGYVMMTQSQRYWVEMQRFMIKQKLVFKAQDQKSSIGKFCFILSGHKAFEFVITACILVNTVLMAMKHFSMSESYESTLDYFNYAFVIIFDIECLIKLIALGKYYFYSKWNLFDFVVVLASTIGLILLLFGIKLNLVTIATIVRAFRMTRIFKYIKASNNLKVLLDTMVYILPSLANIGGLIFLLLFIYAVLGINLFATVKFQ